MIGHKSIEDFVWLSKIRINIYLWSVVAPSVGKNCLFSGPAYYFTFFTFCFCFLHNCGSCIGNVIHFLVNLCGSMLNERGLTVASISEKEWSCARFTLIPTGWSRLIGWRILHKVWYFRVGRVKPSFGSPLQHHRLFWDLILSDSPITIRFKATRYSVRFMICGSIGLFQQDEAHTADVTMDLLRPNLMGQ